MKKKVPVFKSDQELEDFLEQDLTDYIDLKQFKTASFEFLPKTEHVNLRFSKPLLAAVKLQAKKLSIPYQRYIRQQIEQSLIENPQ